MVNPGAEVKRRNLVKLAGGVFLTCCLAIGCGTACPAPRLASERGPDEDLAADFDACETGTITGRVFWTDPLPQVPPLEIRSVESSSPVLRERLQRDNPNAPTIDSGNRAVANAVVFLRGVNRRRSRPWDLPGVRVEQCERSLHVRQGDVDGNVGFVRRGASFEAVSREPIFHSLHGRGPTYFAMPFPDPDQPLTRTLDDKGIVELSSGAGYYWMRAYLMVDDHPYYVRTDAQGRYELPQVPAGSYELVCWLPNWNIARRDRDPESGVVFRMEFGTPLERSAPVSVESGDRLEINLELPPH